MRAFFLRYIKPVGGLAAGVICMLLFIVFNSYPYVAEFVYGTILFPAVRFLLDFTFGLLPFPAFYLFVLAVVILVVLWFKSKGRNTKVLHVINAFGIIISAFYCLWGFNYARPTIAERRDFQQQNISDDTLRAFTFKCIDLLNSTQNRITGNEYSAVISADDWVELQELVYAETSLNGFNVANHLVTREIKPAGILRKLGISGIYFPFSGEGLVELEHNYLEKPFIIAHEMAHGFGIADEGEAKLMAYLACIKSEKALFNYSAHLAMWYYLRYEVVSRSLYSVDSLHMLLTPGVQKDLQFIREDQMKYPEWIPHVSEQINDTYLKIHSVEEGTNAYLSLPILFLKYKKSDPITGRF